MLCVLKFPLLNIRVLTIFFFLKEFAGTRGLGVLTIFFFRVLTIFFFKEFAGTRGLGITWRWLSLALRCLKRA
jgi:hypothetical protein